MCSTSQSFLRDSCLSLESFSNRIEHCQCWHRHCCLNNRGSLTASQKQFEHISIPTCTHQFTVVISPKIKRVLLCISRPDVTKLGLACLVSMCFALTLEKGRASCPQHPSSHRRSTTSHLLHPHPLNSFLDQLPRHPQLPNTPLENTSLNQNARNRTFPHPQQSVFSRVP